MIVPIMKNKTAVLIPREWKLIENQLNADYKIRCNFLLHTATRISEARYISEHSEVFRSENSAIFLPEVKGMGKDKCKQKDRTILLSPKGVTAVQLLYSTNTKFPSYQAMEIALKRAAKEADFDIRSITTKMFRKTYITWLMACYPNLEGIVASSVGHVPDTMHGHYVKLGFRKDDLRDMKDEISEWGNIV